MKKLLLNLETLEVESFDVTAVKEDSRGTVVSAESELGSCNFYCTFNCPFTGSCGEDKVTCACRPPSGIVACINPSNSVCHDG